MVAINKESMNKATSSQTAQNETGGSNIHDEPIPMIKKWSLVVHYSCVSLMFLSFVIKRESLDTKQLFVASVGSFIIMNIIPPVGMPKANPDVLPGKKSPWIGNVANRPRFVDK
mmetsp:Transcript_40320/g.49123  ORF Transcript_40320/g.49123 Transcript_40320/m.49123 type:complete len:114 (+) Transcript_40320:61-402(+)